MESSAIRLQRGYSAPKFSGFEGQGSENCELYRWVKGFSEGQTSVQELQLRLRPHASFLMLRHMLTLLPYDLGEASGEVDTAVRWEG